jgi:hypothetical protein
VLCVCVCVCIFHYASLDSWKQGFFCICVCSHTCIHASMYIHVSPLQRLLLKQSTVNLPRNICCMHTVFQVSLWLTENMPEKKIKSLSSEPHCLSHKICLLNFTVKFTFLRRNHFEENKSHSRFLIPPESSKTPFTNLCFLCLYCKVPNNLTKVYMDTLHMLHNSQVYFQSLLSKGYSLKHFQMCFKAVEPYHKWS